jgi:hypothetical protein
MNREIDTRKWGDWRYYWKPQRGKQGTRYYWNQPQHFNDETNSPSSYPPHDTFLPRNVLPFCQETYACEFISCATKVDLSSSEAEQWFAQGADAYTISVETALLTRLLFFWVGLVSDKIAFLHVDLDIYSGWTVLFLFPLSPFHFILALALNNKWEQKKEKLSWTKKKEKLPWSPFKFHPLHRMFRTRSHQNGTWCVGATSSSGTSIVHSKTPLPAYFASWSVLVLSLCFYFWIHHSIHAIM